MVRSRHPKELSTEKYKGIADHAVNEGFAVTMEFLGIDLLIENPDIMGFGAGEVQMLRQCKEERILLLEQQQNGYSEGALQIMKKIYEDGAGTGSQLNVSQGLQSVRKFLDTIDPALTLGISRDDKEYKRLLKEGTADEWRTLFS